MSMTNKQQAQLKNRIEKLRKKLSRVLGEDVNVTYEMSIRAHIYDNIVHSLWVFNSKIDIMVYTNGQPNLSTAIDALWEQIERNARSQ